MTVEPQNAITVRIVQPVPPKPEDAEGAYRAKLIARFGKVPPPEELARLEACAMSGNADRPGSSRVFTGEARERIAAHRRAEGERTVNAIIDALTAPMTRGEISDATGLAESTITQAMHRALDAGMVSRSTVKRLVYWHRVQVAAE